MDIREQNAHPPDWQEDWKNMILLQKTYNKEEPIRKWPAQAKVCPCCEGQGSCVNPSIDANGISAEAFYEDPEFNEAYLRGHFDIACPHCNGRNVVMYPTTEEGKEAYAEDAQNYAYHLAEMEMERQMGC